MLRPLSHSQPLPLSRSQTPPRLCPLAISQSLWEPHLRSHAVRRRLLGWELLSHWSLAFASGTRNSYLSWNISGPFTAPWLSLPGCTSPLAQERTACQSDFISNATISVKHMPASTCRIAVFRFLTTHSPLDQAAWEPGWLLTLSGSPTQLHYASLFPAHLTCSRYIYVVRNWLNKTPTLGSKTSICYLQICSFRFLSLGLEVPSSKKTRGLGDTDGADERDGGGRGGHQPHFTHLTVGQDRAWSMWPIPGGLKCNQKKADGRREGGGGYCWTLRSFRWLLRG